MSSERVHQDFLEDILDSIEKVARFIQGMTYEQSTEDDKTIYAVIRALAANWATVDRRTCD